MTMEFCTDLASSSERTQEEEEGDVEVRRRAWGSGVLRENVWVELEGFRSRRLYVGQDWRN